MIRTLAACVLLWLVMISAGGAQPVAPAPTEPAAINPTIVQFTASPDHDRLYPDGTTIVTGYQVEIWRVGMTTPVMLVDLGKPTPNGERLITVKPPELAIIPTDQRFYATVSAIGGTGLAGRSGISNPFLRGGTPVAPAPPSNLIIK